MTYKKFFNSKFSKLGLLPDSEFDTMFTYNGELYQVVVSRYHFYYLFIKRVGSYFPLYDCRVKGSKSLKDVFDYLDRVAL